MNVCGSGRADKKEVQKRDHVGAWEKLSSVREEARHFIPPPKGAV